MAVYTTMVPRSLEIVFRTRDRPVAYRVVTLLFLYIC
jgi:hypothetical protein